MFCFHQKFSPRAATYNEEEEFMTYQTENTLEKREARMDAALSLREGDRVPIAPKLGTPYAQAAGISM